MVAPRNNPMLASVRDDPFILRIPSMPISYSPTGAVNPNIAAILIQAATTAKKVAMT
jgi:hypothetical protein